jgi:tRNA(adenine34) deaminase
MAAGGRGSWQAVRYASTAVPTSHWITGRFAQMGLAINVRCRQSIRCNARAKKSDEPGDIMCDLAHEHFMRRAIELARNVPNLPFGAVIVVRESGEIVAEGWNKSSINPTWHGEIDAINQWTQTRPDIEAKRLILYTTAEPCPMCQAAILWCGIETVVFGTSIRFLQNQGWQQIDILAEEVIRRSPFRKCALIGGVLAPECDMLFLAASHP